jgi:hypothetical protein
MAWTYEIPRTPLGYSPKVNVTNTQTEIKTN